MLPYTGLWALTRQLTLTEALPNNTGYGIRNVQGTYPPHEAFSGVGAEEAARYFESEEQLIDRTK